MNVDTFSIILVILVIIVCYRIYINSDLIQLKSIISDEGRSKDPYLYNEDLSSILYSGLTIFTVKLLFGVIPDPYTKPETFSIFSPKLFPTTI